MDVRGSSLIELAFEERIEAGRRSLAERDAARALVMFEEAHILGQTRTVLHVRSHLAMLGWSWRLGRWGELGGQLSRIVPAALFTWIWVPRGNPGSTRVGAMTPAEIPPHLAELLERS
jgi:hypothetical protein